MKRLGLISIVLFTTHAMAGAPDLASWSVDLSTTGQNVIWTSPDEIRTDAEIYDVTFQLDSIDVTVSYLGIPFGPIDVTDQLGDESVQSGSAGGPCPVSFGASSVREPPEPQPLTIAFDVELRLDSQGRGVYSMTDVVLGTASYDLGFPFGEVTVDLEQVDISGRFDAEATGFDCGGDIDGSGVVGVDDLLAVLSDWGSCAGCITDLNGDGVVGVDELLVVIADWGQCG